MQMDFIQAKKFVQPDGRAEKAIIVDVDGTLLRTDLLYECFVLLLRSQPWSLLLLPFWLLRGKAYLKHKIAMRVTPDIDSMPVNEPLLTWLREQHELGVPLGLFSASDQSLVQRVADRFGMFSVIRGSDGLNNLAGKKKLAAIQQIFGSSFTYVGDSRQDIVIWEGCKSAVLTGSKAATLQRDLSSDVVVVRRFESPIVNLRVWLKAIRIHQWAKNGLLVVPFLLAPTIPQLPIFLTLVSGFMAFSLLASATYLLNDLFDLSADRQHRSKRNRPLASGALSIRSALLAIPGISLAVAILLTFTSSTFVFVTLVYLIMTLAYSFGLKRQPILDVLLLAMLFTIRIIAGIAVQGTPPSPWLLTFSMFFFASLAIMKRYSECLLLIQSKQEKSSGRGYQALDAPILLGMGLAAAFCSPLVFFSFLIDPSSPTGAYSFSELLWITCIILAYWLGRAWLIAGRGQMHDDPVVFALRDRVSLALAGVVAILVLIAAKGENLFRMLST